MARVISSVFALSLLLVLGGCGSNDTNSQGLPPANGQVPNNGSPGIQPGQQQPNGMQPGQQQPFPNNQNGQPGQYPNDYYGSPDMNPQFPQQYPNGIPLNEPMNDYGTSPGVTGQPIGPGPSNYYGGGNPGNNNYGGYPGNYNFFSQYPCPQTGHPVFNGSGAWNEYNWVHQNHVNFISYRTTVTYFRNLHPCFRGQAPFVLVHRIYQICPNFNVMAFNRYYRRYLDHGYHGVGAVQRAFTRMGLSIDVNALAH